MSIRTRNPCVRARCRRWRRCAFTLVELMVVIVILGLLATVVTISVTDYLIQAKQNTARAEIATIKNALALYYMEYDRYPTTDDGLEVLRAGSPGHPGGILTNDIKDPWGRPYVYVCPGGHGAFDVMSLGADGVEGGSGADTDIVNWEVDDDAASDP